MEHLMTTEEIAEILHVDPATIRRLVNRGDLAAYRIGADYRFAPSDLEGYLRRQRIAGGRVVRAVERPARFVASRFDGLGDF